MWDPDPEGKGGTPQGLGELNEAKSLTSLLSLLSPAKLLAFRGTVRPQLSWTHSPGQRSRGWISTW